MHDHASPLPLRIVTHNIRYAASTLEPNERPWAERLPKLAQTYKYTAHAANPTIFCLQEVLHTQLTDILAALNSNLSTPASPSTSLPPPPQPQPQPQQEDSPEWTYLGVGRDDGQTRGEYAPIVFQTRAWRAVRFQTVWLSATPETPGSVGWDAGSVRIASVAVLAARRGTGAAGRRVLLVNTHLDNEGVVARREGARLVRELVRRWMVEESGDGEGGGDGLPVVVTGDLNSEPHETAHAVLDADDSPVQDVRTLVTVQGGWVYGERCTFTGFERKPEEQQVLDFIFFGPRGKARWRVLGRAVLPNLFEDGVMISDHRPVVADVVLGGGG